MLRRLHVDVIGGNGVRCALVDRVADDPELLGQLLRHSAGQQQQAPEGIFQAGCLAHVGRLDRLARRGRTRICPQGIDRGEHPIGMDEQRLVGPGSVDLLWRGGKV